MKKVILLAAAAAVIAVSTIDANAQGKGDFWVGGSIGVNTDKVRSDNGTSSRSYAIRPEFGYAFSERWATGIRFDFGRNTQTSYSSGNPSMKSMNRWWGFAPFVRRSVLKWKSLDVFVDGGLSYVRGKDDHTYWSTNLTEDSIEEISLSNNTKTNSYGIFVSPGASLRLSRHLALVGSIDLFDITYRSGDRYDSQRHYDTIHSKVGGFSTNLNSPFNLDRFTFGFHVTF
jgi:hypothetical protein